MNMENKSMNLRLFDGEEEELSLEEQMNQFNEQIRQEQEQQEEETPNDEQTEETNEPEENEQTEESDNEGEGQEQEESDNPEDQQQQEQTPQENNAWKQMRQQLQEEKKYGDLFRQIADKNGLTPDQLLQEYEKKQLEEEAQQKNVPVDVMQRLKKLEQENQSLQKNQFAEKFRSEVEEAKSKFDLSDEEVNQTVEKMDQMGLPNDFPFEDAYKAFNFDKIIEKERENARQEYLEDKKKRQESSAIPHESTSNSQNNNSDTLTNEEYEAIKKSMGLE